MDYGMPFILSGMLNPAVHGHAGIYNIYLPGAGSAW